MKNTLIIIICLFYFSSQAQLAKNTDTASAVGPSKEGRFKWRSTIIPAAALAYGFATLGATPLRNLDEAGRHEFFLEHPHKRIRIDDYMQFAPGAVTLGLSISGVKGRNKTIDQAGIYLVSNIILNSFTQGVKNATDITRPDGTSNAFPSGHAAEAFASAEFMRREYGDRSVWYTITSYTVASSVGLFRMYNNKHWFSDVVAGAGVGILSTQAAYWLYPKIKGIFSKNGKGPVVMPYYSKGGISATLSHTF
ncbi:phosphatase PAP2 family protein [Pedobacter nanyangensis]|jgi:hypothetical protein|uniref:phosphatase PAP2 family protein n=2 Tax=Sphingobacteriaceae TaxID=84566 RepID=UPI000DE4EF70|nr:phosphatase PAP2 family protein [Pedobacter nanyangensis]